MILNLQNIYKDYQQEKLVVPVLKDVSLTVEEGEYVAIMGPSGSEIRQIIQKDLSFSSAVTNMQMLIAN